MKFTIGADPELFLMQPDSRLVSAIDRIGGSKENPFAIGEGCAVQEDNVAAEFCIPPANTVGEFIKSIAYAKEYLMAVARDEGLLLAANVASYSFDKSELNHPKAQEFGCDPDFNCWTQEMNPKPKANDPNLRSAGGHVHVGAEKDPFELGKCMDLYLGVPSVGKDTDTRRRQLYGKGGAIRFKPYGIEYRTLSNFWIWNQNTITWVYNQTAKAVEAAERLKFTRTDAEMIQECINTGNRELMLAISKKFKLGLRTNG